MLLFCSYLPNFIHGFCIKSFDLYLLRADRRIWRLRRCLHNWTRWPTFILIWRCWNNWALIFIFLFLLRRSNYFKFRWLFAKGFGGWRWRFFNFVFFLKLAINLVYCSSSWSYLIIIFICLVFTNIPIEIKHLIWISFNICVNELIESFQKFKSEVCLLYLVKISLIYKLYVNNKLYFIRSFKDSINKAECSSYNGHKWWIVSVFNTFIDHINRISRSKKMPNKHKVSRSI